MKMPWKTVLSKSCGNKNRKNMKTVKFKDFKENVKVGDLVILNNYSDPKLFMCKKNVWRVFGIDPFVYREYKCRKLCRIYGVGGDVSFTVISEKEYKTLPLEAKRKYYTTEQIDEAKEIVRDKVLEIFKNLPWKHANLISYILRPDQTAFGAAWSYNEDNIDNIVYKNIITRKDLEYDGNAGYTLIDIARCIKEGWFDE